MKGVGKSKADRQPRAPLPNKDYEVNKKAAALLLAASLAVSVCATPVFAAENMGSTSVDSTTVLGGVTTGNTKVLYKVTESYQWSIPATIDFGENAGVGKTSRVDANMEKTILA